MTNKMNALGQPFACQFGAMLRADPIHGRSMPPFSQLGIRAVPGAPT